MRILGIDLYNGGINSAIDLILSHSIKEKQNLCISATGAHGIIEAKKNRRFKEILDSFYLNLPDGMPSVWVGRLKGAKKMERCYGPDFFRNLVRSSANTSLKHFLCGGNVGVADKLKIACEEKFNNDNIVGTHCPPYLSIDQYDYPQIAKEINRVSADIVWIGLSSPKQEQFAFHLSNHTNVRYIITVGAAFDFHIGNVKQAPFWIQKIGMEWLFRLTMEPRRLWKRYFEIVPMFIYYNFAELIKGEFFNTRK